MHEVLTQLLSYVRGMWRYRWLALALAWLIAISGWVVVSKIPDEYTSSARVFVDTNSVLRPLLSGLTIQPDMVQRVVLMSRMLLSRPNLEKIVRMSDLDLKIRTEAEKQALLSDLGEQIQIRGDRSNPSLYSLSYQHQDPEVAKRVVQSVVSIFIEESLVGDQRANLTAQDFLDQEIEEYESRLRDSERKLADFKREYAGLMSGDAGGYYANLDAAKAGLKDAELALREAVWRRDELSYQMEAQDEIFAPALENNQDEDPTLVSSADPRIAALQNKLDILLLRYTERHPDIIELKRLIRLLQERNPPVTRSSGPGTSRTLDAGSVYGNLQVALSEADAQVAALKARVEDYSKRVKDLDEKIDSIPTIEAELKQLNRDYTTIAGQHAELLQRRESARLSGQVEKTAEGVKFRVIDPPFVPLKPTAPNRPLLAAGVLVIALGGGLAAALALDLLRPTYDDRRLLYRATGLPVFGTVALVQTNAERRRERLMLIPFATFLLGLLVVFLIVIVDVPALRALI